MAQYYPLPILPDNYYTISGVCRQYDAIIRNPRRDAGGDVPGYEEEYMVWTPTAGESADTSWGNFMSIDHEWILERKSPDCANKKFVDESKHELSRRRITFWRESRHDRFYFIGVYQLHPELTLLTGVRIYRRISDMLPSLEIKSIQSH